MATFKQSNKAKAFTQAFNSLTTRHNGGYVAKSALFIKLVHEHTVFNYETSGSHLFVFSDGSELCLTNNVFYR